MRVWIAGIISTVAGGLAGALGPMIADPDHFSPASGHWGRLWAVAGISATVQLLLYLQKKPLPDVDETK